MSVTIIHIYNQLILAKIIPLYSFAPPPPSPTHISSSLLAPKYHRKQSLYSTHLLYHFLDKTKYHIQQTMYFSKASSTTTFLFMFLLLIFVPFITSTIQANRKLVLNLHELKKVPNLEDMRLLYQIVLPKGTIPNSTPSKKGHSHTINRILKSVPSPGVGH